MTVKAKIRFDYEVRDDRTRRFFWQRRDLRMLAEERRNEQTELLRNLPFQGLNVETLDLEHEVYLLPENERGPKTAYAPAELMVEADSIMDLMQLTLREEFRKIKILSPTELLLSHQDVEWFLFRANEEFRAEMS